MVANARQPARQSPASELVPNSVPHPILDEVINRTPFIDTQYRGMGKQREFCDVVAIKGCFDLYSDPLTASEEQIGPQLCDEYWDDENPETSSLKRSDELELYKPGTDILVVGSVKSLDGKPRTDWRGTMRVIRGKKDVLIQKALRFTGPRWWKHGLLSGWSLSDPQPATEVPLRYELAYGGYWINPKEKDPDLAREAYPQNPSGSGHFGKSHGTAKDYPGPQIELSSKTIGAGNGIYTPGGFGPIARFWQPRLKYAGTYDDAWFKQFHESAIPDYPADFDFRFFQSAPHDQITSEHLRGDEWFEMTGLFEDRPAMNIQLPGIGLVATLLTIQSKTLVLDLKLDTVTIDLDAKKIFLLWRFTLPHSMGVRSATIEVNPLTLVHSS